MANEYDVSIIQIISLSILTTLSRHLCPALVPRGLILGNSGLPWSIAPWLGDLCSYEEWPNWSHLSLNTQFLGSLPTYSQKSFAFTPFSLLHPWQYTSAISVLWYSPLHRNSSFTGSCSSLIWVPGSSCFIGFLAWTNSLSLSLYSLRSGTVKCRNRQVLK